MGGDEVVFLNYLKESGFTIQQREAILSSENLIVEAGAGTGKTKTLVARYLRHILVDGLSPREVVALTFTEKAAQEMRERVQDQLLCFRGTRLWTRASEALEMMAQAPIKTFHGFSSFLLREYPVETGVDPLFSLIDEMGEAILLEEAINGYLSNHLGGKEVTTLLEYLSVFQLKRALRIFFDSVLPVLDEEALEGDALIDLSGSSIPLTEVIGEIRKAVEMIPDVRDHLSQGHCLSVFPKLLSSLETLDYLLSLFDDGEETLKVLVRMAKELGRFPKWGRCRYLEELKRLGALSHHLCLWLEKTVGEGFYGSFLAVVRGVRREIEGLKVREGVLTFSDLQQRMVGALRRDGTLREEIKRRFRRVLVDEYQDTNELQREIVTYLCEEKGRFARDYRQASLEEGKLFIVGDPKQSIYAFRGADVGVYARTKRQLGEGRGMYLTHCFRSGEGLVSKANALFKRIFEDASPLLGPDYIVPFTPLKSEAPGGELWAWWVDAGMVVEEALARIVLKQREKGYRWGDIGVLVRRNATVVRLYHKFLSLGIPVVSSTSGGLLERREIQDILLYLKALDNPADDYSILGLLIAPFVGLDQGTVLALSSSRGEGQGLYEAWRKAVEDGAFPEEKVRALSRAFEAFERLRVRKDRLSINGLIQAVVRETGYGYWLSQQPYGEQALANIDALSRLAWRFQKGRLFTLSEFLISVENRGLPSKEAPEEVEVQDAVSILTVHAAKGLEFPVVILGESWLYPRKDLAPVLYDHQGGFSLKIPILDFNPKYRCVQALKENKKREEEKRLLYVAFTRAKQELHILFREEGKGGSWQAWLLNAGIEGMARKGSWDQTPQLEPKKVEPREVGHSIPSPLVGVAQSALRVEVVRLLPGEICDGNPILGSFFHKAMKEIGHPGEASRWYDLHSALLAVRGVSLTKRRFTARMRAYFKGAFYRDVIAPAEKVLREVPLEAPFGRLLVTGRPDVVVIGQDGEVMVGEYKLEGSPLHRERFVDQLALYSWLVEQYMGKWPHAAFLYYILPGKWERLSGEGLRERALALLNQGIINLTQEGDDSVGGEG